MRKENKTNYTTWAKYISSFCLVISAAASCRAEKLGTCSFLNHYHFSLIDTVTEEYVKKKKEIY